MLPAMRNWTRDEMMKRVAFFRNLKGSKTGLPDSDLPESERELINVIGFHPPHEGEAAVSPVGSEAALLSATARTIRSCPRGHGPTFRRRTCALVI